MPPSFYPHPGGPPLPSMNMTANGHVGGPESQLNPSYQPKSNSGYHNQQAWSSNSMRPKEIRPLTVNEALPYSPFTSIVPLDSSIISLPGADITTSYPIFANTADVQDARQHLENLDRSLARSGHSGATNNALGSLQSLLDREFTDFVFKKPYHSKPSKATQSSSSEAKVSKRLSPFANMLLKATDIPYRYPPVKEHAAKEGTSAKLATPITPRHIQQNKDAYVHNSQASVFPESTIAPQHLATVFPQQLTTIDPQQLITIAPEKLTKIAPETLTTIAPDKLSTIAPEKLTTIDPQQVRLRPEIVLPAIPLLDKSQYQVYVETEQIRPDIKLPPVPTADSKQYQVYVEEPRAAKTLKRKHDRLDEAESNDYRALANNALQALLENLSEIFEAQDNIQGGNIHVHSEGYFVGNHGTGSESLALAPAVQVKLDSQFQKVITYGRFNDVPFEQLMQIHKLCENALINAESVAIRIQPGWGDDVVSTWLERLETIDNATRSARTALRIMNGGRAEKQILSEELLQRIIGLLTKVTDTCIVPMVESRSSDADSTVFQVTSSNKKVMSQLLHNAGKLMQLLIDLLAKEELAESPVTALEFFVIRLLFVENAVTEKESVLGIHKFEAFRRSAMNVIAAIFSQYPEQRQFIINEVLTSLQKLPTAKVRARQYKLGDGKRLQLVSVLLIRLVQTSGMRTTASTATKAKRAIPESDEDSDASSDDEDSGRQKGGTGSSGESDEETETRASGEIPRPLLSNAKKLYDSAGASAQHIVKFLVHRASSSSKSGDQPHRHILDMFVEDLISVLSLPDWPAAELLLRALVSNMVEIVNDHKGPVPAKNMALEILGTMASAILDINAAARQTARGLENTDAALSEQLTKHLEDHHDGQLEIIELASWVGPFRIVLEYLNENNSDVQSVTAQGYFTTQWVKYVLWGAKSTNEPLDPSVLGRSQSANGLKLCKMLYNGKWSNTEDFDSVTYAQCRLAYLLILSNVGFCRAFGHILNVLVQSCSSEQARIKTRSLKSVTQMVERDPLLLDRLPQVKNLMFKCITDASSQVRDNTLALISECIIFKPALEIDFIKPILICANDVAPSLRKRAIRTMKDIYLRNSEKGSKASNDIRIVVADHLLQRVEDTDEPTSELAKLTFEDIWLAPFWNMCRGQELSVQDNVTLKAHFSLIIQTVERSDKIYAILEGFLHSSMAAKSKNHALNAKVCKAFVTAGFEGVIDTSELPGQPEQRSILQTLTVFARANPGLFSQQQVAYLQPYIVELKSSDDLNLFRWSVIILRCVLPTLPAVQKEFLKKIQDDLLKNVTKLAKAELNEVAACLWTINGVLENIERLVNVAVSVLTNLHKLESSKFPPGDLSKDQQALVKRIQRFLLLAGHFGRHCDFQSQNARFKIALPWLSGDFVAGKIVGGMKLFAAKQQPMALRAVALDSIGMVCQAWPRNFNRADIVTAFQEILRGDDSNLQNIVLSSFRDFFASQDQQFTVASMSEERDPLRGGKLGGSMTASDNDGAAALIAQGFLKDVLRIALSSQDSYALTATEVVASITRQGLVHPKECGPALVALETSTNPQIAEVAYQQHQNLHQQHESMFEREYMRAIHEAFVYQRDIVKDSTGYVKREAQYRAKLHSMYEVVKTSKGKYQAKFLIGYCSKIDFDPSKPGSPDQLSQHLAYARFLIENMAFFDYGRVEDVMSATSCMEKVVASTGAGIAHAINTEVFKVTLDPDTGAPMNVPEDAGPTSFDVDPERLQHLTTASMILSMLWEARTYVRYLYGVSTKDAKKEGKGKALKETNKAPTKTSAITGDKVVNSIARIGQSLDSREASLTQCKEFAELLAIDDEVKVAGDDMDGEGIVGGRLRTPSVDEDDDSMMPASGGSRLSKRKGSASLAGTPLKKKRGRPNGIKSKMKSGEGRMSMDRRSMEDAEDDGCD